MFSSFFPVLLFLAAAAVLVFVVLFLSRLLAPHKPNPTKLATYECGEVARGISWIRFNSRFYIIALIFIIFDVEVVFLYPWAVVYRHLGLWAWLEMAFFLAILLAGLAYVWAKGDLEWIRMSESESQLESSSLMAPEAGRTTVISQEAATS
ncbi:MAG: NADH-quinone oxidoreductase subunit A [Calditrichaeota bacterium]|nr:NADH-quinone oxidoreductase subunit A [Calditrichota bacterium]